MCDLPIRLLRAHRQGSAAPPCGFVLQILLLMSLAPAVPAGVWGNEESPLLALTEEETVRLALRNNRTLISARLQREVQRFSLEVSEDRYRPRATIDSSLSDSKRGGSFADLSLGPTLRIPTGGEFSLFWSQPLDGGSDRNGMGTLGFSQPLLRGFGTRIDTAPVRLARLDEQRNILFLRDTIIDVIVSAVFAYRSLIRADQALAIDRESLARSERQVEINRSLIRAGRMAEREIVQTEAEVANRALALAESENSLTRANARLLSILDVEGAGEIRPERQLPSASRFNPNSNRACTRHCNTVTTT